MIRCVVLAAVICFSASGREAFAAPKDMTLWIDVDGTAYLRNNRPIPLTLDGYQITSEAAALDPVGWNSISDQAAANPLDVIALLGAGALTFGEANPNSGNLSELNLGGAATLEAGATFAIGKPFLDHRTPDDTAMFIFKSPMYGSALGIGDIIYAPEPSASLLAALAGVGLLAVRRRGLRVSPVGPQ
jgi:hypothetical protein